MKKALFVFLMIFFAISFTRAQNLVPNPGFEDYFTTFCGIMEPNDFNLTILDWQAPTFGATSAYFTNIDSTCYNFQPDSQYGGPIGIKGTQLSRTGNVMAGIWVYTIDGLNQRQYVQVELNTPMTAGNAYIISFYVSLADFIEFSINSLGAHLSINPVTASNDDPLNVMPQIVESSFVDDISNWILISDTIVVEEDFRYLTIGNFLNDDLTTTQANPTASGEPGTYGAYYFVDDVSIEETVLTDIRELDENKISIFPNPFDEKINLRFSEKNEHVFLKIYNAQGIKFLEQNIENQLTVNINCSKLPAGIYFIQLEGKKESFIKKIIKY